MLAACRLGPAFLVRLILDHASDYCLLPEPPAFLPLQVLSVSIDFYVRVFVRVYTSPQETKNSPTKLAYVYQSKGCDSFFLQRVGRKVAHP